MADEATQGQTQGTEVKSPLSSQSQPQGQSGGQQGATQQGQSGSDQSTSGGSQGQTQTQGQTQKPTAPDWLPDATFWDAEKGELKGKDLGSRFTEMATRIAAEDVRKGSLPQAPEAYKIELPADFKAPAGVEFKFDANDPILPQAQAWAHSVGMTQEQFAKGLGLFAAAKVGEQSRIDAARAAEVAKLGPNASSRVDSVVNWMKAMDSSANKADAAALAGMLVTSRHIEAFERLITKFSNQGTATFDNRHRDRQPQGTVSDAEYEKMSPAQKLDYSRQFDQSQFQKAS